MKGRGSLNSLLPGALCCLGGTLLWRGAGSTARPSWSCWQCGGLLFLQQSKHQHAAARAPEQTAYHAADWSASGDLALPSDPLASTSCPMQSGDPPAAALLQPPLQRQQLRPRQAQPPPLESAARGSQRRGERRGSESPAAPRPPAGVSDAICYLRRFRSNVGRCDNAGNSWRGWQAVTRTVTGMMQLQLCMWLQHACPGHILTGCTVQSTPFAALTCWNIGASRRKSAGPSNRRSSSRIPCQLAAELLAQLPSATATPATIAQPLCKKESLESTPPSAPGLLVQ